MALAFYIDGHHKDAIAEAFAAHDEYLSIFSYYLNNKQKNILLTPTNCEYFPAPFCYLRKTTNTGFLVFTFVGVPWIHGNYSKEKSDLCAHAVAAEHQRHRGQYEPPHLGSVEKFQDYLQIHTEVGVCTFTKDGCYPTREDVSQALENKAVELTCATMGWNIPQNWREVRKQIRSSTQGIPFLDLAEWDRRQKKNTTAESNTSNDAEEVKKNDQISSSCNTGNNNNNNSSKPSDGGHSDNNNNDVAREEEKKDSVEEYSC